MRNVDEAEEWLDSWVAGVNEQAARTAQLARQVSELTATARSEDGGVVVTVGSNGQLEHLELTDRELARTILTVLRAAQRRLSEQVAAEVQRTVGADTETGRAVVDAYDRRFPTPPVEDADGR
jgi:hypothetical protein